MPPWTSFKKISTPCSQFPGGLSALCAEYALPSWPFRKTSNTIVGSDTNRCPLFLAVRSSKDWFIRQKVNGKLKPLCLSVQGRSPMSNASAR